MTSMTAGKLLAALRRAAADVHTRWEACTVRAEVRQALVQPFLQRVLGVDVFDPFALVPDSTGSTAKTSLKHPDARVEYAVRRGGAPVLLVAVFARRDRDGRNEALDRLSKCLEQSQARLGAITDGRTWEWIGDLREAGLGVSAWARTVLEPGTLRLPAAQALAPMHQAGWDQKRVLEQAALAIYTARARSALMELLTDPSEELVKMIAGMVHAGQRTPRVLDLVGAGLRAAIASLDATTPPSGTMPPALPQPRPKRSDRTLALECDEPGSTAPTDTRNQADVMRWALDRLASRPGADEAFGKSRPMTRDLADLPPTVRANPSRYWSGNGWYTSIIRPAARKAALINELARALDAPIKARVVHVDTSAGGGSARAA